MISRTFQKTPDSENCARFRGVRSHTLNCDKLDGGLFPMYTILSTGRGGVGQTRREICEASGDANTPGTSSMTVTAGEPGRA